MTPKSRRKTAPKAPGAALPKAIASVAPAVVVTPAVATEAPPTDTELAFLALYAEDAFQMARKAGTDLVNVRPDPRLAPQWTVTGTLTAVDAVMRIGRHKIGAKQVFYGWRLCSTGGHQVLAIRGTATRVEWLIDCTFAPKRAHPVAGRVESGFWDVFESMRLDGKPMTSIEGPVTVVGHSLGAAVATFSVLELARAGRKVRGVFVASPHPGDREFCEAFGKAVPDHVMYANVDDMVPRVPLWFGYSDVPNVVTLSAANLAVTGGLAGQHHILTYAAMMDRNAFTAFKPLPIDKPFLNCIHFPSR